jgi:hypothetical protein
MVNSEFRLAQIQSCVTTPVERAETMSLPCSDLGNHESTSMSKIRYLNDDFAHLLTLISGGGG